MKGIKKFVVLILLATAFLLTAGAVVSIDRTAYTSVTSESIMPMALADDHAIIRITDGNC